MTQSPRQRAFNEQIADDMMMVDAFSGTPEGRRLLELQARNAEREIAQENHRQQMRDKMDAMRKEYEDQRFERFLRHFAPKY